MDGIFLIVYLFRSETLTEICMYFSRISNNSSPNLEDTPIVSSIIMICTSDTVPLHDKTWCPNCESILTRCS